MAMSFSFDFLFFVALKGESAFVFDAGSLFEAIVRYLVLSTRLANEAMRCLTLFFVVAGVVPGTLPRKRRRCSICACR
jgi:hypothetical protein